MGCVVIVHDVLRLEIEMRDGVGVQEGYSFNKSAAQVYDYYYTTGVVSVLGMNSQLDVYIAFMMC